MAEIRQTYKNRAEAYVLFIQPGGYGVSRSKFYEDCGRRRMIQQDKSLLLSDLLAYAKSELETAKAENRPFADEEYSREMRELDLREKRASVNTKEKAAQKDNGLWMLRADATDQAAALVVLLRATLRHHVTSGTDAVILAAGGNPARAVEVEATIQEIIAKGFNDLACSREARLIQLVAATDEDQDDIGPSLTRP